MTFDNTIEHILFLVQKDHTTDREKQSELIDSLYDAFDEKSKAKIDVIIAAFCGYSLDTIINHPEDISLNDNNGGGI